MKKLLLILACLPIILLCLSFIFFDYFLELKEKGIITEEIAQGFIFFSMIGIYVLIKYFYDSVYNKSEKKSSNNDIELSSNNSQSSSNLAESYPDENEITNIEEMKQTVSPNALTVKIKESGKIQKITKEDWCEIVKIGNEDKFEIKYINE